MQARRREHGTVADALVSGIRFACGAVPIMATGTSWESRLKPIHPLRQFGHRSWPVIPEESKNYGFGLVVSQRAFRDFHDEHLFADTNKFKGVVEYFFGP